MAPRGKDNMRRSACDVTRKGPFLVTSQMGAHATGACMPVGEHAAPEHAWRLAGHAAPVLAVGFRVRV